MQQSKKHFQFLIHLIFLSILFYAYQDIIASKNIGLREADRTIAHISLGIVIAILGFTYTISILNKTATTTRLIMSMILILFWCVIADWSSDNMTWQSLTRFGIAALWIFTVSCFHSYSQRHKYSIQLFQKYIFVFLIFYSGAALYASYKIAYTSRNTPVLNLAYYVLVFLPWVLMIQKKLKRTIGILIIFFIVFFSMKRGAILSMPIILSSSLLAHAYNKGTLFSSAFKIIGILILFLLSLMLADHYSQGFLTSRFTTDALMTGSGRNEIYETSWKIISDRDISTMLMGSGTGTFSEGLGLHNEWLEFLFCYGIIGILLYCNFIFQLLKTLHRLVKLKSNMTTIVSPLIAYILIVGLYGSIYFSHSTIFIMILLGTIGGIQNRPTNKQPLIQKQV